MRRSVRCYFVLKRTVEDARPYRLKFKILIKVANNL